jgi:hypothetical protein
MVLSEQNRNRLKKNLPPKWLKTLETDFQGRYSRSYIEKVVRGSGTNIEILEAAIELAEKNKKTVERIRQKLNGLN